MSLLYVPRRPEGVIEKFEVIEDKSQIVYRCARCGAEITLEELEYLPSIKCVYCGYRVLYKVRAPGSKIIRAI